MVSNSIDWSGTKSVNSNSACSYNIPAADIYQNNFQTLPNSQDDLFQNQQGPPPVTERGYVPAYLAGNIGKNIRAEFVINNAQYDKVGRLIEVGINYFVLEDINSRTHIMCDLYSVKFVTVII